MNTPLIGTLVSCSIYAAIRIALMSSRDYSMKRLTTQTVSAFRIPMRRKSSLAGGTRQV